MKTPDAKPLTPLLTAAISLILFLAPVPAACLRFAVVGDTQPNFDNPLGESRVFTAFLNDMSSQSPRPAFLLHAGDFITGWTSSPGVLREQYKRFRDTIKSAPFPIHFALGNHEGYTPESIALFRKEFGPTYHSFDSDGWHFILLDITGDGYYGTLDPKQSAWLKADLEGHRAMKGTFVTLHMPLQADDMEPWIEVAKAERDRLHAQFLAGNVKAVFNGHVHTYELAIRDGIRYYTTGGGGGELESWPPVSHFFHYLIVDADDGYLGVMTRKLEDIEAGIKAVESPKSPPVIARPGSLLDGFEDDRHSGWTVYNALVKLSHSTVNFTEGQKSLRMEFDFAKSLWPMLIRGSSTTWDLGSAGGVSVDIWASPGLFNAPGETPRIQASIGGYKSLAMPVERGKWTTVRWNFANPVWSRKKGGELALNPVELKSVGGFSLNFISDTTTPRKGWDYRMKGYALIDNLKAF